jgi:hypothetical protein
VNVVRPRSGLSGLGRGRDLSNFIVLASNELFLAISDKEE